MKYELAKALKDTGFPQNGLNTCTYRNCRCHNKKKCSGCDICMRVRIPSLSELIEACGNDLKYIAKITIRTGESKVTDGWEVCQNVDKNEIAFAIQEFTLEEALAKFYIALHKV